MPLSSNGRIFVRRARQAIDASRAEALKLFDPGAADLDQVFARKIFHQRVLARGPVRAGRELHALAGALSAIPCCPVRLRSENKRAHFLIVGVPRMDGHPMAEMETDALTFDGIAVDVTRNVVHASAVITGAISAHALGRWGERDDVEPEQAPRLVRAAHAAAIALATVLKVEQSIALRLTQHRRADGRHNPAEADADAYLVGNLRRHPETERLMFADWRTVSHRDWIVPDLARFGDLLTGILRSGKETPLPYVPPRTSYADGMRKTA